MDKMTINELKIHVICWTVYICLEVIALGLMNNRISPFSYYLMFYSLNFGLFYFHSWIVMQSVFAGQKSMWKFCFFLTIEVLLYLAGAIFITYLLSGQNPIDNQLTGGYFAGLLWRGSWFIAYSTGYFFIKAYLKKQRKESEKTLEIIHLRTQLLVAEKDYLRAQINPHLFFNTLTFIKYASKRNPLVAAEAVQELSEIMSYALYIGKSEFVPLYLEIGQIEKILNLNQLRYEQQLNVEFIKEDINLDMPIAPILLLTLVENIFKHGNITDLSEKSLIELMFDGKYLIFKTSNPIGNFPEENRSKSGLKNVRERLSKTYPEKFEFVFGIDGNQFKVCLKIDLTKS